MELTAQYSKSFGDHNLKAIGGYSSKSSRMTDSVPEIQIFWWMDLDITVWGRVIIKSLLSVHGLL